MNSIASLIYSILAIAAAPVMLTAAEDARYVDFLDGNDFNDGRSIASPWRHVPGMPGCTASCGSYRPAPGAKIVLRGGVTWPGLALPLKIAWEGTAVEPITITSEREWFAGEGWSRPKLDGEYLRDGLILVDTGSAHLRIQRLELMRHILTTRFGGSSAVYLRGSSEADIIFSELYVHDWKRCLGPNDPTSVCIQEISDNSGSGGGIYSRIGAGASMRGIIVEHSRIGNPENGGDIGACLFGIEIVRQNYIHDCSQGLLHGGLVVNDNVFRRIGKTFDRTTHTNVVYSDQYNSGDPLRDPGTTVLIYNNEITECYATPGIYPNYGTSGIRGGAVYQVFNNAVYGNINTIPILIDPYRATGGFRAKFYIDNNTIEQANTTLPLVRVVRREGAPPPERMVFRNNHLVGGNPYYQTDFGGSSEMAQRGNVVMSALAAAEDGYSSANAFRPILGTAATVNAGVPIEVPGQSRDRLGVTRPQANVWDAGAYEFAESTSAVPAPPRDLTKSIK